MQRVNVSLTAAQEQAILSKLIRLVPSWVGPDALTLLALLSALGIAIAYFYANHLPELYLVAAVLYAVHWLGDSLDGKIARERAKQRPDYGHYADHMLDSISAAVILISITLSAITLTEVWLLVLAGFLLLMAHAFLKANVTDTFELSVGLLGPTESRILAAALSVLLYYTGNPLFVKTILHTSFSFTLLDILGVFVAAVLWTFLMIQVVRTARQLDKRDRLQWKTRS